MKHCFYWTESTDTNFVDSEACLPDIPTSIPKANLELATFFKARSNISFKIWQFTNVTIVTLQPYFVRVYTKIGNMLISNSSNLTGKVLGNSGNNSVCTHSPEDEPSIGDWDGDFRALARCSSLDTQQADHWIQMKGNTHSVQYNTNILSKTRESVETQCKENRSEWAKHTERFPGILKKISEAFSSKGPQLIQPA